MQSVDKNMKWIESKTTHNLKIFFFFTFRKCWIGHDCISNVFILYFMFPTFDTIFTVMTCIFFSSKPRFQMFSDADSRHNLFPTFNERMENKTSQIFF